MAPLPRWITHSASFAIGGLVAAAALCLQKERGTWKTEQQLDDGSNNNTSTIKHQSYIATNRECTVKLPIHTYKPNANITIVFDTRTKNPVFVIERLQSSKSEYGSTSSSSVSVSRNNKRFHEEQTLPTYHRSRNSHYRNSGYDRGHLAPAADFSSAFTSSSPDDDKEDVDKKINDTFTLTNISPQLPQFNRLVWLRLEEFVRRAATKEESDSNKEIETWVISGPIWLPTSTATSSNTSDNNTGSKKNVKYLYTYEGIGQPPSLVSVPTHFFKVVLVVEKKKMNQQQSSVNPSKQTDSSVDTPSVDTQHQQLVIKKFGAFVLPHSDHNVRDEYKGKKHIRLVDYLVRLTDLEAVTGLDFFPFIGEAAKYKDIVTMNEISSSIISKEVADALTDDVRYKNAKNKSKMIDNKGDKQHDTNTTLNSSPLPSTLLSNNNNKEVLSKNRRRKIKEILQKNNKSIIPIEHLCRNNNDCYRLLRV